jgi:hypothetical protein
MDVVLGKKQKWSINETIPLFELLVLQEAHGLRMSEKCVLGILRPMKRETAHVENLRMIHTNDKE